jgi:hypothetical protein
LDGIPYDDMAVMCRYNTRADDIATYMKGESIPVFRKNPSWEETLARLCAWANLMSNPHNPMAWSVAVGGMFNARDKKLMIGEAESTGTNLIDLMSIKGIEGVPIERQLATFDADTIRKLWLCCGGSPCEMMETVARQFSGVPCREFTELMAMEDRSQDNGGVAVGTIHAFKGLEYQVVFLMNFSQSSMPGSKKGRRKEEERRLVFVAQTRAIDKLIYINNVNDEWTEFLYDEHRRFLL